MKNHESDTKTTGFGIKFAIHLKWKDPRLSWKTENNTLEVTQFSEKLIWTPDLTFWNSLNPESDKHH